MAIQQLATQAITADVIPVAVSIASISAAIQYFQIAIYNAGSNPVWLLNATEAAGASGLCIPAGAAIYTPVFDKNDGAPRLYAAAPESCKASVLPVIA